MCTVHSSFFQSFVLCCVFRLLSYFLDVLIIYTLLRFDENALHLFYTYQIMYTYLVYTLRCVTPFFGLSLHACSK